MLKKNHLYGTVKKVKGKLLWVKLKVQRKGSYLLVAVSKDGNLALPKRKFISGSTPTLPIIKGFVSFIKF